MLKLLPLFLFVSGPLVSLAGVNDGRPSLLFMENRGQVIDASGAVRPDVLFTTRNTNARLFISRQGIHYQFTGSIPGEGDVTARTATYDLDMELLGADPNAEIVTDAPEGYYENYYYAHCPQGITHVPAYRRVTFRNVYAHIDWVIYSDAHGLKYDFIVHPDGNVQDIRMRYSGENLPTTTLKGGFLITTPLGVINEEAPLTFQGRAMKNVGSRFVIAAGEVTFAVDAYDPTMDLVIDPGLQWATYYGGTEDDDLRDVAIDANGNIYATGSTESSTGIADNGIQDTLSALADALLVKFNADGVRQWATYYGGEGYDYGNAVALDASGPVYMAGTTSSQGLAFNGYQMVNALGPPPSANDALLVKFQPDGTRIWATYYGGSGDDGASDVVVGDVGDVYVIGTTRSASVMASGGSHQVGLSGTQDAFLADFNAAGARMWSTYFGGTGFDAGVAVAFDGDWGLYIAGSTSSSSGIALSGHQNGPGGGTDGFVARFDVFGVQQWGTYYGGSGIDQVTSVAVDGSAQVFISGSTSSTDSIAFNGHQNAFGGSDSYGKDNFLVSFNDDGVRLWGTYYGGTAGEKVVTDLWLDGQGHVCLLGSTRSASVMATANGWQPTLNGVDFDTYVALFDYAGNRVWATYFGGEERDYGNALAMTPGGALVLAGYTYSVDGIAFNGVQNDLGGGTDGYLAILDPSIGTALPDVTASSIIVVQDLAGDQMIVRGMTPGCIVQLLDATGRALQTLSSNGDEARSDLRGLAAGTYVLLVLNGTGELQRAVRLLKR